MTHRSRIRILCVDDEPTLLDAMSLLLRRHFEVSTATSGAAALDLLTEDASFAVIVTDMRMPGMSGATFLSHARQLAPDARRILLTGETDIGSAIAAINEGRISRFLTKPCPPATLLEAINRAIAEYRAEFNERSAIRRDIQNQIIDHDALTGLTSREGMLRWMTKATTGVGDGDAAFFTAFFVNIDGFNHVDDPANPLPGETLIREVAQRIRVHCAEALCVARWGLDQFVVVSAGGSADGSGVQLHASELVDRLASSSQEDGSARIDISVGAARWPFDSSVPLTVIRYAELAMRKARQLGSGSACVFRHEWQQRRTHERDMLAALRQSIEADELQLHYQPIISAAGDEVHALECLARWEHRKFGNVPPATFIPLAEESGLIGRLGEWILRRACIEGQTLIRGRSLRIAVNISMQQIMQPDFVTLVESLLAETEFPPDRLEIELTESVFANDLVHIGNVLSRLKQRGVTVAIDDFGTGYSSLASLSQLPINVIKVDRSFVNSFEHGGKEVISAALSIAHSRGIALVVEGIETTPMLQQMRDLGVNMVQGYLYARPMPAGSMNSWLQSIFPIAAEGASRAGVRA